MCNLVRHLPSDLLHLPSSAFSATSRRSRVVNLYLCSSAKIMMIFLPFKKETLPLQSYMVGNNDIAQMLALLHELQGIDFIRQLRLITERREFSPLATDPEIFIVGGETSEDYSPLLNAARKAVEMGNRVFILPNPKGCRTADYIFERKGVYKMFDLKTISGRHSVDNRLSESVGQTNRVLLHMTADYNPGTLARTIKRYFELNANAREVLVYKGKKQISVTRKSLEDAHFFRTFIRRYTK